MNRYAVFVDSFYVYRAARRSLQSAEPATVAFLAFDALRLAEGVAAVRVPPPSALIQSYWYDIRPDDRGAVPFADLIRAERLTFRRAAAAFDRTDEMVETMLFSDVLAVSRNRSVDDVVIVGDGARFSVLTMLAQGYGVRVHLIQVSEHDDAPLPAHPPDSHSVWGPAVTATFLRERPAQMPRPLAAPVAIDEATRATITEASRTVARSLTSRDFAEIQAHAAATRQIPSVYDAQLLFAVSGALGRPLEPPEKIFMRRRFLEELESLRSLSG